jgi:hypothetical protein
VEGTQVSMELRLSAARTVFKKITPQGLVASLLAGLPPSQEWTGCEVSICAASAGEAGHGTFGVVTAGPGAQAVLDGLAGRLEQLGIPLEARGGHAEPGEVLCRAEDGRWV